MRIDRRLLGWGLFFIIAGSIPLLTRVGVLDANLVGRWPALWPTLLIAWGIGLLLRRTPIDWIGGAISVVVFGVMAGGALTSGFGGFSGFAGCGDEDGGTPFQTQSGSFGTSGRLEVELNCGSLAMTAADGAAWSVSGSEASGRAPSVTTNGDTVTIEDARRSTFFDAGSGPATWRIAVPRSPQVGLGLTLNAGSSTVDLAGANLRSVNLTVNAGSAVVDLSTAAALGDVNGTVNAGSARFELPGGARTVNLSLNAGSLDVCVPAGTALRVTWGGALGSNDLDRAGLVKVDGNTWTSSGFSEAQPHTELHVSANAGSFGLDTDGTCDG